MAHHAPEVFATYTGGTDTATLVKFSLGVTNGSVTVSFINAPEPAMAAPLLAGFGLLAFRFRRRQRGSR